MDLTKITTPFGLLPPETQKALKEHGGEIEVYGDPDWKPKSLDPWFGNLTYRVRPEPPKPREWWISLKNPLSIISYRPTDIKCDGWVHVREVIE